MAARRGGADRGLRPRRSRRPTASRSPPTRPFALDGQARIAEMLADQLLDARAPQLVEAFELAGS